MKKEENIKGLSAEQLLEIARQAVRKKLDEMPEGNALQMTAESNPGKFRRLLPLKPRDWRDVVCEQATDSIRRLLQLKDMGPTETLHRIGRIIADPYGEHKGLQMDAAESILHACSKKITVQQYTAEPMPAETSEEPPEKPDPSTQREKALEKYLSSRQKGQEI